MSNAQVTKPQMLEYYFEVKQSFKYDGRIYESGEQWIPGGFRFDAKIIQNGKKVQRVEQVIEASEAARRPAKIVKGSKHARLTERIIADRETLECMHCKRDNFKAQNGLTRHINMMHKDAVDG